MFSNITFLLAVNLHLGEVVYLIPGTLLEKRYLDNKVLLTWSHQSVSAAANMCYFVKTDLIKQTHRDIGELFLETWLDNKPMVIPQQDIKIIDNGYRYIAPQPLLYSETKYNFRRLSELWYQCLRTGENQTKALRRQ